MLRPTVKKISIILGFLVFSALVYRMSVYRITQNFYTVDSGKLYRSAQLSDQEINELIQKYQIKTVLSLRGYPPKKILWHNTNETENLPKLGINFVPVDLDDNYFPSKVDVQKILDVLEKGPHPILVHCRVGTDRTGMVSAMYEKYILNKPTEEALLQLQFKYWHVPSLRPAMSEFIKKAPDLTYLKNTYNECLPEFADLRDPDYVCN